MSVQRIPRPFRSDRRDLVQIISDEINRDSPDQRPGEPQIIEEYLPGSGRFSVTIIWERWQEVPTHERGAVIMDAYDMSARHGEVSNINATLGVTPEEAEKFGIKKALAV
jgi:hypothetical protein